MRITRSTDYAVRVLLYAASRPSRLVQIQEVADYYLISKNHLMKIVHTLSKNGLIESYQGRNGGFQLRKMPKEITLGEIVQLFEDVKYLENFSEAEAQESLRNTKDAFDHAFGLFIGALQAYTMQDLLETTYRN